jgi:hypothetical protein
VRRICSLLPSGGTRELAGIMEFSKLSHNRSDRFRQATLDLSDLASIAVPEATFQALAWAMQIT